LLFIRGSSILNKYGNIDISITSSSSDKNFSVEFKSGLPNGASGIHDPMTDHIQIDPNKALPATQVHEFGHLLGGKGHVGALTYGPGYMGSKNDALSSVMISGEDAGKYRRALNFTAADADRFVDSYRSGGR
jgi:hypothetical protein